jgi:hypothetical protein
MINQLKNSIEKKWRRNIMKLYKVKPHSKIKIIDEDVKNPSASLIQKTGDVLDFEHIDGMYSLCYDKDRNPVHIAAWTEVEVLDENSCI